MIPVLIDVKKYHFPLNRLKAHSVHTVIAYAASMMLSGIPPEVCESSLTEVISSVKKSLYAWMH